MDRETWRATVHGVARVGHGLAIKPPLVVKHRLKDMGFSRCGVWAQLPQDMWNLPRPGIEPMFPELAGRLLTTGSPKKSLLESLLKKFSLGCSAHQIIQNDLSWKSSGFPGSSVGKESACNARDPGSIPRSGRSIGEG